jgi:hypothetical protein
MVSSKKDRAECSNNGSFMCRLPQLIVDENPVVCQARRTSDAQGRTPLLNNTVQNDPGQDLLS